MAGRGIKSGRSLTAERLRCLLDYNSLNGDFTWREARGRVSAGTKAGRLSLGYVKIRVDGIEYRAHRLAWLWMTDHWPTSEIDHRNLHHADNAWTNLRLATRHQQQQNVGVRVDSKTGFKGVKRERNGAYTARIFQNGVRHSLGSSFHSAHEANAAYAAAAEALFGDFSRPT